MSEQFNDNNRNGEYHYTRQQLDHTVESSASQQSASQQNTSYQNASYQNASQQNTAWQNTSQQGAPYQDASQQGGGRTKAKKHEKHGMTTGKKWALVVSMALVFGLIAGGTMFGVNTVANYLAGGSGKEYTKLEQTQTTKSTGADTSSAGGSGTVASVAESAMPSLVTISTMSVEEMQSFFGGTQQYEVQGAGTGVIVGENDTELLIATNYHVVEGAASLSVGFIDEQSVEGQVKGTDVNNDLAVVAVKLSDIPSDTMEQIKVAAIGDSDELKLGDQVVAIGNALGYGQSVTSGYVSALDRDLTLQDAAGNVMTSTGLIQTDAAINSGNSGGALLNMNGELVGINEAKSSSASNGASVDNIGFAIPIDKAQESLQEMMNLETREKVDDSHASFLGIRGSDVSSEAAELYNVPEGAVVSEVIENGPAARAGLEKGDIITELDGRTVTGMTQLQEILQYYAAGEKVDVVVQRSGNGGYEAQTLSVTLGSVSELNEQ